MRDLRNHGGDVVDRAARGEHLTITRRGKPVAELRPLAPPPAATSELIRRRSHLPSVDTKKLRADIDALIDRSL
ncbi:MAG: type II toxin-antitoxin system prevent-host-death family antitoxin [Actinobacteria bacterium]|nr:type II toxin-antitoxin system prevent-host-death family antitoxin [Actinomycetota bacterium]